MKLRARANVTLALVDRVEGLLASHQAPLAREAILKHLKADRHGTTRPRLNAAIAHLARHHIVHDAGKDGVVWLSRPSLKALERLARARLA